MQSGLAIFGALVEGLVVRHCVDPDTVSPSLFAEAVQALLPAMTRPVGDDTDLADVVAPIARFTHAPRPATADPDVRRRLLDATQARADAGTYREATIEELAVDAGAPVSAAYAEFRGKPALAAAAFARHLPMLERPIEAELAAGRPPPEIIRAHLGRLAAVAARHRGLTNALLEAVQEAAIRYGTQMGANDPRTIIPLPQLLEPVMRAGQDDGTVRDDFDAFELAALVTNMLLVRIMTRQLEPAEKIAEIVGEVAVRGVSSRR